MIACGLPQYMHKYQALDPQSALCEVVAVYRSRLQSGHATDLACIYKFSGAVRSSCFIHLS